MLIELCETRPDTLPNAVLIDTSAGHVASYRWPSEADALPLVLLHGAGATTALETQHLARLMQSSRPVVAFDLPGHGASDTYDEVTADLFTRGVGDAIASLDQPVDLFGFSLGGAVALSVAQQLGDSVRHLAVHATSVNWDAALVSDMLARLDVAGIRSRSPQGWQRLDDAHQGRADDVFASLAPFVRSLAENRSFAHDLPPHLPKLVTSGDADELFDLSHALYLRTRLAGSQLGILPGLGHRLGPDEASALAPILHRFLEG